MVTIGSRRRGGHWWTVDALTGKAEPLAETVRGCAWWARAWLRWARIGSSTTSSFSRQGELHERRAGARRRSRRSRHAGRRNAGLTSVPGASQPGELARAARACRAAAARQRDDAPGADGSVHTGLSTVGEVVTASPDGKTSSPATPSGPAWWLRMEGLVEQAYPSTGIGSVGGRRLDAPAPGGQAGPYPIVLWLSPGRSYTTALPRRVCPIAPAA